MLTYFPNFFTAVNLWNRTKSRAEELRSELNKLFPGLPITVLDTSTGCVNDADVVVTATSASSPLFGRSDFRKASVHVNGNECGCENPRELLIIIALLHLAIGAGVHHHSEVNIDVYQSASVFIESNVGIQTELKGIEPFISGEIGELIDGRKHSNESGVSLFQSMGNALEDGVMANLIYQKFMKL